MRIAVIGAGSIGKRHIANLLALGCDVTVWEPDPHQRAAARSLYAQAHYVSDWRSMLVPDALVIASPYDTHLEWADRACFWRRPFFVEKPLGSLEQIASWRQVEIASASLVTQVGYMLRFHPKARQIKAVISDPKAVSCRLECDMATWPGQSYGPMLLECSHEIDLALWLGADGAVTYADLDSDEAYVAFANGAVSVNAHSSRYWREWSASGSQWLFQWAFSSPDELGTVMYHDEMAHFLECVQTGRQTDVPLRDGLRVLEVLQQATEKARAAA